VTVNGNRTLTVNGSSIGNLTLNNTTAATLKDSSRGTASGAGTLLEDKVSGTATMGTEVTKAVTFDVARPNATYTVVLDPGIALVPYVTNKLASGFTITFGGAVVATVYWSVLS
jgi:hypothetical protein